MELLDLRIVWFVAFTAMLLAFTVLDGFDLGVGMLQPFVGRDDNERRLVLNSIGPVWDGNEVWLVAAGGALFAAFPAAYATIFSGFYLPMMVLLAGLIFRAVAIEFRSKQPMVWWRRSWDTLFCLASLTISFGLGLVLGNMVRGIPLDPQGDFIGNTIDFFHPYALLLGATTVALCTMHGCIYLLMKTEGALHDHVRKWVNPTIITFIMFYVAATMATLIYQPHMVEAIRERPHMFFLAVINMFAIANIPREVNAGRDGYAFLSSCATIALLFILYAVGLFPTIVRASNAPEQYSLTVFNSASSDMTLQIMLIVALIGLPLVFAYTIAIYWIFRGKVRLGRHSY